MIKVLIVDDNEKIVQILKKAITDQEVFEVVATASQQLPARMRLK